MSCGMATAAADTAGPSGRPQPQHGSLIDGTRVLFSCCKGESHTHKAGFKQLYRRVRSMYRPEKLDNPEDLCLEVLLGPASSGLGSGGAGGGGSASVAASPAILVLGCPSQPFTAHEFDTLRAFLRGGGSLLVAMAEGGERQAGTNLNYLLEELGIAVNADAVVRTAHYKYLHPKEALISDGVLNRALLAGSSSSSSSSTNHSSGLAAAEQAAQGGRRFGDAIGGLDVVADGADALSTAGASSGGKGLSFVYPFGCTLSVQSPAVPILSSGKISYPMQRPLAACWASPQPGGGRVVVLGAAGLFHDSWLDKEDNSRISDFVFRFLRPGSKVALHAGDAQDPDIAADIMLLPDTETLADRPKPCLAEVASLPRDWARLFDGQLHCVDMRHVPEAVALYGQLGVKKAPLSLIPPAFETPLPQLMPATFPPVLREPPPPGLELYDLDEALVGEAAQLAALVAKCKAPQDLDYFLVEAAALTGLRVAPQAGAKAVLAELLRCLVQYKSVAAFGGGGGDAGATIVAAGPAVTASSGAAQGAGSPGARQPGSPPHGWPAAHRPSSSSPGPRGRGGLEHGALLDGSINRLSSSGSNMGMGRAGSR